MQYCDGGAAWRLNLVRINRQAVGSPLGVDLNHPARRHPHDARPMEVDRIEYDEVKPLHWGVGNSYDCSYNSRLRSTVVNNELATETHQPKLVGYRSGLLWCDRERYLCPLLSPVEEI